MKNYLIAGLLFVSIPLTVSGMFLDIQDIERSREFKDSGNEYKETVYIEKKSADKANFVFSLNSLTPGRFFGKNTQNRADVIVTILESDDKSKAKITITTELNASLGSADAAIKSYAKEWAKSRQNFSESFFDKEKQQLEKDLAESKAKRFYNALNAVAEDATFDVDAFIQSLSEKTEEPALAVQLAPKLEELAYALLSLR